MSTFIVKRISYYEIKSNSRDAVKTCVKAGIVKNSLKPVKKTYVIKEKTTED